MDTNPQATGAVDIPHQASALITPQPTPQADPAPQAEPAPQALVNPAPQADPAPQAEPAAPQADPAPQAEPAPQQADLVSPTEPAQNNDWREALPEQWRDNPIVTKYNDMGALLEGFQNSVSLNGKKGLQMPDPNDEQAMNDYFAARGRPDTPSEYEWQPPLAEDGSGKPLLEIEENELRTINERFHKAGMPKDLQKVALDVWAESEIAARDAEATAAQVQATQARIELEKDWGSDFNTYLNQVNNALQQMGLADQAVELGLANNAQFVKMVHGLIKNTGTARQFDPVDPLTNKSVDQRIEEIRQSPAYQNPGHPNHHDAVQRFQELFKYKIPK